MDAAQVAERTRVLRPRPAVPIHYAFTAGRLRDAAFLKLVHGRPDLYRGAAADLAPDTDVRILEPGEPLSL